MAFMTKFIYDQWIPLTKGQWCSTVVFFIVASLTKLLNKQLSYQCFEEHQRSCVITVMI